MKLEMIGINLQVNLNFQSDFKLNLLQVCRQGSFSTAAAALPIGSSGAAALTASIKS